MIIPKNSNSNARGILSATIMTIPHVLEEIVFPITDLAASFHRTVISQGSDMNCPKVANKFMLPLERTWIVAAFPLAFESRSGTRVGV